MLVTVSPGFNSCTVRTRIPLSFHVHPMVVRSDRIQIMSFQNYEIVKIHNFMCCRNVSHETLCCPLFVSVSFVATVSQGDPWSSTQEPPCCVWLGSQENPSSQPPLLAALRSGTVSAQPDCCSGDQLKHMLQTVYFNPPCRKLDSS